MCPPRSTRNALVGATALAQFRGHFTCPIARARLSPLPNVRTGRRRARHARERTTSIGFSRGRVGRRRQGRGPPGRMSWLRHLHNYNRGSSRCRTLGSASRRFRRKRRPWREHLEPRRRSVALCRRSNRDRFRCRGRSGSVWDSNPAPAPRCPRSGHPVPDRQRSRGMARHRRRTPFHRMPPPRTPCRRALPPDRQRAS